MLNWDVLKQLLIHIFTIKLQSVVSVGRKPVWYIQNPSFMPQKSRKLSLAKKPENQRDIAIRTKKLENQHDIAIPRQKTG
jgi:hypothetical protein